jgi:hypothetical protein
VGFIGVVIIGCDGLCRSTPAEAPLDTHGEASEAIVIVKNVLCNPHNSDILFAFHHYNTEINMQRCLAIFVCLGMMGIGNLNAAAPSSSELRVDRARAATVLYRNLSALSMHDRKVAFRSLSAPMKAELWKVHFREFAEQNALSPAQQGIVEAASTLLSADFYAISKTDPRWESQVHVPLQRLEMSARNLFPRELLMAAFAQIGPVDSDVAAMSIVTPEEKVGGLIVRPEMVSECTCSMASDWCFNGHCGGSICYLTGDDWGCGFGWRYECDAKCERDQP